MNFFSIFSILNSLIPKIPVFLQTKKSGIGNFREKYVGNLGIGGDPVALAGAGIRGQGFFGTAEIGNSVRMRLNSNLSAGLRSKLSTIYQNLTKKSNQIKSTDNKYMKNKEHILNTKKLLKVLKKKLIPTNEEIQNYEKKDC